MEDKSAEERGELSESDEVPMVDVSRELVSLFIEWLHHLQYLH